MAKFQEVKLRSGEVIRLTDRESLFCEHYLADSNRNATQAAIKAGLSPKTAYSQGQRMLNNVEVDKYIKDKTAPLLEALGITHERILRERAALAFTNLTDLVDNEWRLKNKDEIDPKFYPALNQVTIKEKVLIQQDDEKGGGIVLSREISYKTADKDKSLAMLEKATGLIKEEQPQVPPPPTTNLFLQLNQYVNNR
jgi:phage terminase small subunit